MCECEGELESWGGSYQHSHRTHQWRLPLSMAVGTSYSNTAEANQPSLNCWLIPEGKYPRITADRPSLFTLHYTAIISLNMTWVDLFVTLSLFEIFSSSWGRLLSSVRPWHAYRDISHPITCSLLLFFLFLLWLQLSTFSDLLQSVIFVHSTCCSYLSYLLLSILIWEVIREFFL